MIIFFKFFVPLLKISEKKENKEEEGMHTNIEIETPRTSVQSQPSCRFSPVSTLLSSVQFQPSCRPLQFQPSCRQHLIHNLPLLYIAMRGYS